MPRTPLFNRVPEIWRRLDRDQVLERFLAVLDDGLDRSHDLAEGLFALRSVDDIPDRYLDLLGELVGHRWRSDKPRAWNRRKIRDAIRLWSYKGTYEQLRDIIRECGGGTNWSVVDMASRLLTLDLQGGLSGFDAYFEAEDYYHDGAFVLRVSEDLDVGEFSIQFVDFKAAGTRWYLVLTSPRSTLFDSAYAYRLAKCGGDRIIMGGTLHMDSLVTMGRADITFNMGTFGNEPPAAALIGDWAHYAIT